MAKQQVQNQTELLQGAMEGISMGRKKYSEELKRQAALDVPRGHKTVAELTSEYVEPGRVLEEAIPGE